MTSVGAIVIGGVVGAIIGALWGDPFRDSGGRYTTHENGLGSWIFQSIVGAALGAALTPVVMGVIATNPIVAIGGLGLTLAAVYVTQVDPR